MGNENKLTHFNESGAAHMVDVTEKPATLRSATATATVLLNPGTYELVRKGGAAKGDVLSVARVAGIMAAKKNAELIPLCHPVGITSVEIGFELNDEKHSIGVQASVKCKGETGVEMEALTAASVAALTIYDMCKAAQKDIVITDIRLLSKTGGKSGDYYAEGVGTER